VKVILPMLLIVMTLVVQLVSGIHYVTIPVLMTNQGYSNSWIGVAMAVEIGGLLLLHKQMQQLVARLGLRPALVMMIATRGALCYLMSEVSTFGSWMVVIFVYGLANGMLLVLLQTWLNVLPLRRRGLWMGLFSASLSLGVAAGPVLLQMIDLALSQRFYLSAALNLPLLLLILPAGRQRGLAEKAEARLRFVFRFARPVLISALVGGVAFFGLPNFLTLYGMANGLSEARASLLMSMFMLGSVTLGMGISLLSDWLNRQMVMAACIAASVICGVYLSLAMYSSEVAVMALLYLWGGCMGGIYSIGLSILGDRFHPSQQLSANICYNIMDSAGGIFGLVFIGILMDQVGPEGLPLLLQTVGCLFLVYIVWELVNKPEEPARPGFGADGR
jgi:MFS family permease